MARRAPACVTLRYLWTAAQVPVTAAFRNDRERERGRREGDADAGQEWGQGRHVRPVCQPHLKQGVHDVPPAAP